jgi:hypothetical protein
MLQNITWAELLNQFEKPISVFGTALSEHLLIFAQHIYALRRESEFTLFQILDYSTRQREKLLFLCLASTALDGKFDNLFLRPRIIF